MHKNSEICYNCIKVWKINESKIEKCYISNGNPNVLNLIIKVMLSWVKICKIFFSKFCQSKPVWLWSALFFQSRYWQEERSHLELIWKIKSPNLLCLQLIILRFGRSWVRIPTVTCLFRHDNGIKVLLLRLINSPSLALGLKFEPKLFFLKLL